MPPREDIKLTVYYRDPNQTEYEGRLEVYEGPGEILAHLSFKHAVGVQTDKGFLSLGLHIVISNDDLQPLWSRCRGLQARRNRPHTLS